MNNDVFIYFYVYEFHLDFPFLISLQEIKQIGIKIWLLIILLTNCIKSLYGQYTTTPDPQTTLMLCINVDPIIFKHVNQERLSRIM